MASGNRKSGGPGPKIPFCSVIFPMLKVESVCDGPTLSSSLQVLPCHSLWKKQEIMIYKTNYN